MIIVKLQGGLGNQLFQYAFGTYLATRQKTVLKLDTSWYGTIPDRHYDLGHFNISAGIASRRDVQGLVGRLPLGVRRVLHLPKPRRLHQETRMGFDASLQQAGPDAYIEGYFQSERYFADVSDKLRQEFTLRDKPQGENAKLLKEIGSTNSVSIHIRRGDYVSNKVANSFHGTCSPEYYDAAISLMAKKVKNPHFYVFSDDPDWTKENISIPGTHTYITHNALEAWEDLRLMGACKHAIIANSTFSWWGAWLIKGNEKHIIAPKHWFADDSVSADDITPATWLRI